jgi:glucose/arabinose dehydrogenase
LSSPVALAWRHDDARMYVAEQPGRVRIVNTDGTLVGTPVLTLTVGNGGEQGLLGLAFSADGTKLYVDYVDNASHVKVVEYAMAGDTAIAASGRTLLSIDHPLPNHNGGEVVFGPDGSLYVGTGDGGGAGDPGGNGQNPNALLGKILRIDPTPSASLPYTIPGDNPFVGQSAHREEIWMWGLRNPWRFTFDRANGDLWTADVGQGDYEEVDHAPAGERGTNYGWNLREGFHPYNGGAQPPGGHDPLFEKAHTDGYCAVIGGYVYRGSAIANLDGAYVFGDLCRSTLSAVVQSNGAVTDQRDFTVGTTSLTTFGEDPAGELYVANLNGSILRLVQGAPPNVSVGDRTSFEGNAVSRAFTLPVTLSQPSTAMVTVEYAVEAIDATGGTKPGNDTDFKIATGEVVFKPNASGRTPISKTITVRVFGDTVAELAEQFRVKLSDPTGGYGLGRSEGVGTILDDDGVAPGVVVGIGEGTIVEANSGPQMLTTPVTMSGKLSTALNINYTVTPGTAGHSTKAAGGGDFGGKLAGTVKLPAKALAKNISIPIWPALVGEPDETFTITLSSAGLSGVTLIRATATNTIAAP